MPYLLINSIDLLSLSGEKTHICTTIVISVARGQFLTILANKAEQAGLLTVAVKPHGTTQECSCCGKTVKKALSDRWHSCPHCNFEADRDLNAARNIKNRAVGHSVLKAHRVSQAIAGVGEKPALYTSVSA